jgi:hypothetical protein
MRRVFTVGVIFFALLLVACGASVIKGSGKIVIEKRSLTSFDHIKASGNLTVKVMANQPQSVAVATDDNLQAYILTTVSGHTLKVSIKPDYKLSSTQPIQLAISAPKLKKVTTAGAVKLNVSGVESQKFSLYSQGTSTINASGKVTELTIGLTGTGQVDTSSLLADQVAVDVNGTGKAIVYASRKLVIKISGAGVVTYYGNPPIVNRAVFGGGQVQKASQPGS